MPAAPPASLRPLLRPAVFLDRDDTILDTTAATRHTPYPGDLVDIALVRLLPGAAGAIKQLNDANLPVIIVSNQGAIARGTPVLRNPERQRAGPPPGPPVQHPRSGPEPLPLPEGGGRGKGSPLLRNPERERAGPPCAPPVQHAPHSPSDQHSGPARKPDGGKVVDGGDAGDAGDGGDEGERQTPSSPSHLPHPLPSIKPFTLADLARINQRMLDLLHAEAGARIDAIYSCPYHPKGSVPPFNTEHPWRKPAPGMLLAAALDHNLDLARSWMIGDSQRDIDAALAAGIPREQSRLIGAEPHGLRSLAHAVESLLAASPPTCA